MSKRIQTTEIAIGENVFYVRKFRALAAARISGDVIALLAPALGGISGENAEDNVLSRIAAGLKDLSGDRLEALLKELLIDEGCISYEGDILTADTLDEVFCGDVAGLFRLAIEIIKLNYQSLFTLLGDQFGSRAEAVKSLI
jgi:hypothetical protein